MLIRQALAQAIGVLRTAQIPDPTTDAARLLAAIVGLQPMELTLHGNVALTPEQELRLSSLLFSRASRKPLQYVLGTQHFYGLPFIVNEHVLIPRPETETLCELALSFVRKATGSPEVLDLCTGSGAIAVVIKHECPGTVVTAIDISQDALCLAERNARNNQVNIRFLQGDLFGPVAGKRFDCILSNPPYVERGLLRMLQDEVLFEPVIALDGGADGLDFYRQIVREAPRHLHSGGLLCLEVGDGQGDAVCALLAQQRCFASVTRHDDLRGMERVVLAKRVATPQSPPTRLCDFPKGEG